MKINMFNVFFWYFEVKIQVFADLYIHMRKQVMNVSKIHLVYIDFQTSFFFLSIFFIYATDWTEFQGFISVLSCNIHIHLLSNYIHRTIFKKYNWMIHVHTYCIDLCVFINNKYILRFYPRIYIFHTWTVTRHSDRKGFFTIWEHLYFVMLNSSISEWKYINTENGWDEQMQKKKKKKGLNILCKGCIGQSSMDVVVLPIRILFT